MIYNEELLSDGGFSRLSSKQQFDIIAKHCVGIEKRIRSASSRSEAERISADECLRFQHECPSEMLRKALTQKVKELIIKHWQYEK